MSDLENTHCLPCENIGTSLNQDSAQTYLREYAKDWKISSDYKTIFYDFKFKNYYHVIAFVNALAWMAHQENHHPDLEVSYNHCIVRYSTHALQGLTKNDFICAAKANALFRSYQEKYENGK